MPSTMHLHSALLRSDGFVDAFGCDIHDGECDRIARDPWYSDWGYVSVATGRNFTLYLQGNGKVTISGEHGSRSPWHREFARSLRDGTLPQPGYRQIAAGSAHIVLLTLDGFVLAEMDGPPSSACRIPALEGGLEYIQVAAGNRHTVLLVSDGTVRTCGLNDHGQRNIPVLEDGLMFTAVSAGEINTGFLVSDGTARLSYPGRLLDSPLFIPELPEGLVYTQISVGGDHVVLLRSDGSVVAIGHNDDGQCDIPQLTDHLVYSQVAAGARHTVLLVSDGTALAVGCPREGLLQVPVLPEGVRYIPTPTMSKDFIVELRLRSPASAARTPGDLEVLGYTMNGDFLFAALVGDPRSLVRPVAHEMLRVCTPRRRLPCISCRVVFILGGMFVTRTTTWFSPST